MISEEEPEKTVKLPASLATYSYTGDVKPTKLGTYRMFTVVKNLDAGDYLVDETTGKIVLALKNGKAEAVSESIAKTDIRRTVNSLGAYSGEAKPASGSFRLLRYGGLPKDTSLDEGDYLVNDADQVAYAIQYNFPPDLRTDVSKLTATEKLQGPQAETDSNTYSVWQKTDNDDGNARKYLVDQKGVARYLVDPGINGTHRFRPDETSVTKFDAPKATLMSYIIKGILDRRLPWGLVILGVMIAVVLEMVGIPSLAFAVGVYLPLSTSSPIFVGGVVRYLVDRNLRKKLAHKNLTEDELNAEGDKSPGVLMASGYIAGGALAGIAIAFMAGVLTKTTQGFEKWSLLHNPLFDEAKHPKPYADLLSMLPFALLVMLLYMAGREMILAARKNST
jgi:hypothetical protein